MMSMCASLIYAWSVTLMPVGSLDMTEPGNKICLRSQAPIESVYSSIVNVWLSLPRCNLVHDIDRTSDALWICSWNRLLEDEWYPKYSEYEPVMRDIACHQCVWIENKCRQCVLHFLKYPDNNLGCLYQWILSLLLKLSEIYSRGNCNGSIQRELPMPRAAE